MASLPMLIFCGHLKKQKKTTPAYTKRETQNMKTKTESTLAIAETSNMSKMFHEEQKYIIK